MDCLLLCLKSNWKLKKKKQLLGIEKQIPTGPVVMTYASTAGHRFESGKSKIPHAAEPKINLKKSEKINFEK